MNVKQCNAIFASFRTLLREYNAFVAKYVADGNLSPNEISVLHALRNISTASAIARDAEVSKALVSRSVKSLREKGLIEITISDIDKREQNLQLTDKGREIASVIERANEDFCALATKNTDDKALRITQLMLEIIINNLNPRGGNEYD